ncbi:unnamed protein product [Hapterophycus canaliculatus]
MDDVFGSDSSGDEFDPAREGANDEGEIDENAKDDGGGGDALSDSDPEGDYSNATQDQAEAASPRPAPAVGGTGLSDSEDENDDALPAANGDDADDAAKKQAMDADVFGSDSEDEIGPTATAGSRSANDAGDDVDPFQESDDDEAQQGGSGGENGKTLGGGRGRLSKGDGGGKGKGKKRKSDADVGSSSSSKKKPKGKKGEDGEDEGSDNPGKKKKKKKRKRKDGEGEDGDKKKIKKKKKKTKKKKAKTTSVESSTLQDLGLESSADEAAQEEEEDDDGDDDFSDEEAEHVDEEEGGEEAPRDEKVSRRGREVRTKEDDDFIDDTDDHPDLLVEYEQDAPDAGEHSEAEEDNGQDDSRDPDTPKESVMNSVLASMKKRKAQDLSTAEREQIAQEFMFKINQAAEDDEEAVQEGRPALNKLKMLKTVKATLAKKELQETFLEFDLLGVVKRWLQPYSNGQLPNLTIRKEMLALVLMLPVQVDHLKRSGIGKVVMGLLNSKQETTENKRVLRELVSRWNRPVYEKATRTNYGHNRSANDELEAMEARPRGGARGAGSGSGMRRVVSGSSSQRDGPSKNEAVGNILNARARGLDPTKSRVPFSNGYAFSKAPRSKVEGHGRAPAQQVDTSARAKLLKKMAVLARPVNKSA